MRVERIARLAALPPSEVEWEELLVRVEVMPRALRFALEQAGEAAGDTRGVLTELVEREAWAAGLLEQAAGVRPATLAGESGVVGDPSTLAELVERFNSYRARNFAMVQRRGVEVWNWMMQTEDAVGITTYQLLTYLAQADVEALAAMRAVGSRRVPAC